MVDDNDDDCGVVDDNDEDCGVVDDNDDDCCFVDDNDDDCGVVDDNDMVAVRSVQAALEDPAAGGKVRSARLLLRCRSPDTLQPTSLNVACPRPMLVGRERHGCAPQSFVLIPEGCRHPVATAPLMHEHAGS